VASGQGPLLNRSAFAKTIITDAHSNYPKSFIDGGPGGANQMGRGEASDDGYSDV